MRNVIVLIFMAVVTLCSLGSLVSCSYLNNYVEDYKVESISFDTNTKTIKVGGLGRSNVIIEPADAVDYYDVAYTSSNTDVITIYESSYDGVVFYGEKVGSAYITAKIDDKEDVLVVNVEE